LERKYLSCLLCPFPSQFIFPPLLKGRVREGLSKNLPPVSPLFKEGGRLSEQRGGRGSLKNLPLPLFKKEGS